jgi:hypothetical protein
MGPSTLKSSRIDPVPAVEEVERLPSVLSPSSRKSTKLSPSSLFALVDPADDGSGRGVRQAEHPVDLVQEDMCPREWSMSLAQFC